MEKITSKKRISSKSFVFIYYEAESIPLELAFNQLMNNLQNQQVNEYFLCKNGKILSCWFGLEKNMQIYSRNKFSIYNTKLEKLPPDVIEHSNKIQGLNKVLGQVNSLEDKKNYLTNIARFRKD